LHDGICDTKVSIRFVIYFLDVTSGRARVVATPRVQGPRLSNVATCGYNLLVTSTGIRELKDNLSRYIRRIEAGERIAITAHGRVVAELVPPGAKAKGTPSRFDELVASGVIRPPLEAGDPTAGWPDIRLPAGTAAELIDADRGEA
jgi:antitoxin (DNA-binding transcriptional repressor) of toxin-antitoxin stability system